MDDFASTALFGLIVKELRLQGLDFESTLEFTGKTERSTKADLLDFALEKLGPIGILKIGGGIRSSKPSPMGTVLMKAKTVPDLLQRWQRLEVYFHGNHRVRTVDIAETTATLEHLALKGDGPSIGEDLVIAGLLAALFQSIGTRQLSLCLGGSVAIQNDAYIEEFPCSAETRIWEFSWSHLETAVQEIPISETSDCTADRVRQLLMSDMGRSWKLASVADLLAVSTRTLQRQLAQSGTSFQSLLRSTRADCAALMLVEQLTTLPEIGFATGFSDQAHFSRDFKLRFNMSPKQYLALNL